MWLLAPASLDGILCNAAVVCRGAGWCILPSVFCHTTMYLTNPLFLRDHQVSGKTAESMWGLWSAMPGGCRAARVPSYPVAVWRMRRHLVNLSASPFQQGSVLSAKGLHIGMRAGMVFAILVNQAGEMTS